MLAALAPRERPAALADRPSGVAWLPDAPASPHLARYGIAAQAGDGVVLARGALHGMPILIAAQDERFLRGTVGAMHADALRALFDLARRERPAAVVLLLASAGVRLHEANAAEIALGRALRSLLDARADGVPVLAIAVGDVFGGTSVLACACDRLALLPDAGLGLSGPRVIEAASGRRELDTADRAAVQALYGADARAAAGIADLVADDAGAVRAWVAQGMRDAIAFPLRVLEIQERLVARSHEAGADEPEPHWLDPVSPGLLRMRPAGGPFGPRQAIAADAELLAADDVDLARPRTLLVVEDSRGHPPTRAAEALGVSQYLAHHAAVLALLRSRGHRVAGLLGGTGHSAAFFVNALQADVLYAAPEARVVALAPDAIASVLKLGRETLDRAIADDALLGHPVRHFAALGGVTEIVAGEAAAVARIASASFRPARSTAPPAA